MVDKQKRTQVAIFFSIATIVAASSFATASYYYKHIGTASSLLPTGGLASNSTPLDKSVAEKQPKRFSKSPPVDFVAKALQSKDGETYPISNLAEDFHGLDQKAKSGDLIAARTLYRALKVCKNSPRDEIEFGKIMAKHAAERPGDTGGAAESRLGHQQALWARCGALTDEQRASLSDLATQLADSGDPQARLEYPMAANPTNFDDLHFAEQKAEFVDRAKGYLNEEIDSGNASALRTMALAYMPPVLQGQYVPFEVNPAMAYQYYYAYGLSGAADQQYVTGILVKLESQLDPEQIEQGRSTAAALVQCCKR